MFLSMLIGLATEVDMAGLGCCALGLWLMESLFWKAVKPQHGTQVVGEACSPGGGDPGNPTSTTVFSHSALVEHMLCAGTRELWGHGEPNRTWPGPPGA